MSTFATIVSQARVLLQDTTSVRYTDAELMVYANDALKVIRRVRPDTFFNQYATAITDYTTSSNFPIGIEFEQSVRDFIVAYAEYLKKNKKIVIPKWADFVKTGKGKEIAP
jgi:hypothetical protein